MLLQMHTSRFVNTDELTLTLINVLDIQDRIIVKRKAQVSRMKAAQVFDPLHVKANGVTLEDIAELSCFKFHRHPKVAPHIAAMKAELTKYTTLVAKIKPFNQRAKVGTDGKQHDT